MAYNYLNFLKTLTTEDRVIQVLDSQGKIKYSINPFNILNTSVRNNVIKINLKENKNILLDFSDANSAKAAISQLQAQISTLTNKIPFNIDKQIENYVLADGGPGGVTQGCAKSGYIPGYLFDGTPSSTASVAFTTPYESASYSVAITMNSFGSDDYIYSVIDKSPTGFVIRIDAAAPITGTAMWITNCWDGSGLISGGGGEGVDAQGPIGNQGSTGPQGSPQTDQNLITPLGGTLVVDGTMSVLGDLIPGTNSLYNLGSIDYQWKSLYVGTSSIYIGGVTISSHDDSIVFNSLNLGTIDNPVILRNDEGQMIYGDVPVTKYFPTSSTPLQLPDVLQVVTLETSRNLSYSPMQQVAVWNVAYNGYVVDDYVDDDSVFFTGQVSGYVSGTQSGLLDVIVNYSSAYGMTNNDGIVPTYSFWNIDISPVNFNAFKTALVTGPTAGGLVLSDGSENNLTPTNDLIYDGFTFSINADTKFLGQINIQQVNEKITTSTASSEIFYDYQQSSIWYHDDLSSGFTASFINVPDEDSVITFNIVIIQSGTAYLPENTTVNGSNYSIFWSGGTLPTGTPNFVDIIGLSIIQYNGNTRVLGQVSSFDQP